MAGLTAVLVLNHALFAADASNYQTALADAQARNSPLLVLVGAEWCPGCQTMKHSVLPALARRGGLRHVTFVSIDADAEAATAQQLMRGGSIPQLIIFSRAPDGRWHREQIIGATSEQNVQSLIARAIQAQQPAPLAANSAIGN